MDIELIEQKPITLAEVGVTLENIKLITKELGFRAEKVNTYVTETAGLKKEEADSMFKKLEELKIPRLRDRHLVKIIDIMPEDIESLKTLFSGEAITLKQEELSKILETLKSR